jgi:Fe2+ or Zn2+ uptake regulation protein
MNISKRGKQKKERITSQKKIILDYLSSVTTHPSAEKVYLAVKKKLSRVSLGTVYRILKNLKEKGVILEIPAGVSHYDADISQSVHFICQKCRKIFDVFEKVSIPRLKKTEIKAGKIKSYQIYFYGLCKKCQKKK